MNPLDELQWPEAEIKAINDRHEHLAEGLPPGWKKFVYNTTGDFGVLSLDTRPPGDIVKFDLSPQIPEPTHWKEDRFTLDPGFEPYIPTLNEIADYHDHQATWFPDGKDAQWHRQAAKHLRDIGHDEQAPTG